MPTVNTVQAYGECCRRSAHCDADDAGQHLDFCKFHCTGLLALYMQRSACLLVNSHKSCTAEEEEDGRRRIQQERAMADVHTHMSLNLYAHNMPVSW